MGPTSASGWRFLPSLFRKGAPRRVVDRASTMPYTHTKPGVSHGLLARTQTLLPVGEVTRGQSQLLGANAVRKVDDVS